MNIDEKIYRRLINLRFRKIVGTIVMGWIFMFKPVIIEAESKKNILYITSGTATYASTHEQMQGFTDYLRGKYEVYFEHLNSLKYPTKEHEEAFKSLLSYKLKIYPKFDAVVLADDSAAGFGIKHQYLFQGTPIFLTSVSDNKIIYGVKQGIVDTECVIEEGLPLEENVNLIGKIYNKSKEKKNLILITGPQDIYDDIIDRYYKLENKYKNINFENKTVTYKSEKELKQTLRSINNKEDIVLFWMPTSPSNSKVIQSSDTDFSSIKQILESIKGLSKAPIFTNFNLGLEYGFVGGYTVDLYKQGLVTGKLVKDFLEEDNKIPKFVDGKNTNRLIFNQEQMYIHNIKRSILPKDVEIISKTDSFFEKYKDLIIFVAIIFIFVIVHYIVTIQANKKLKEAKKIAEEASNSKSNFIANISHELRTPVTVIYSSVQLLKKHAESNCNIDKNILMSSANMIEQNSNRLTRLINNIIDVAKADTGFKSLILQNVEIINFIESTVQSVAHFAKTKDIEIVFDTQIEELIIAVDLDKIDRIILNLLSNAIKFSYNGGSIFVDLDCNEDIFTISVKDSGIGIAQENIKLIFDKFMQIDNGFTRLNEGSGIGLSLVKSFVSLHNGKIDVKSELGKGTCFTIYIPRKVIDNGKVIYSNPSEYNNLMTEFSDII